MLLRRSPIYYDRLDYIPENYTPAPTLNQIKTAQEISMNQYANSVCVGQQCCSSNTVWDNSHNLCIIKESFIPSTKLDPDPYAKAP